MNLSSEAPGGLENVSRETLAALRDYVALLGKWQGAINLIGPSTLEAIWTRHVADSLQLLPLAPPTARQWADFGSGAGFPGLVLAIALKERPGAAVQLYESDGRKATFLREAIRRTGAPAVVHEQRVEAASPFPADVITARAFAPLEQLLGFAAPFWAEATLGLFPKGRKVAEELEAAGKRWRFTYDLAASRTDSAGSILVVRSLTRV